MEAGEAAGAVLFLLAAAVSLLAAVSTGALDFTYLVTVVGEGSSTSPGSGGGAWWREAWVGARSRAVAPALQVGVWACMVMSVMLVVEATYNSAVSVAARLVGWRPEWRFKWEPLGGGAGAGDEEKGEAAAAAAYPMVMVQIPMYNELEVYKLSIGAVCGLKWPKERLIIQVLDDSTDAFIKNLVELECEDWASKGLNIKYATRSGRKGFKAGALKKGMEWDYAKQCEYVAIFDADFHPEPDFLLRTVPFLMHNQNVALVQARWVFGKTSSFDMSLRLPFAVLASGKVSLLTRIQRTFLDYHFKAEQEAGSATFAFFSFNGTAGVWRTEAINDAGGWKDRTTVEDMDLAVRATLKGWKFIYLGDLRVKSELPSTYKAYCRQQFRWSCGGANLFRKMIWDVLVAKVPFLLFFFDEPEQKVSSLKKIYMLYSFFLVRRVVAPAVAFILYNVIIPVSVMIPELFLPIWGVAYIPTALLIVTAIRNPENLHTVPLWILFESVMSMHRLRAAVAGLLQLQEFNQWIVTKKVGNNAFDENNETPLLQKSRKRVNLPEIGLSVFLIFCASYNLVFHGKNSFYINLYLQGLAFFLLGLNCVGTLPDHCCF
uniref:glucomannan 4-beta-mannosyltransferase n=1 Tax=Oryza barthii TaxID=65489 RepID=A0A0D3FJ41_9ORYZ